MFPPMLVCARCGAKSPEGFRFCGACGAPLAPDAAPRQERKVVSVLFCDLVGSTAQAERLDPEDVQALLSRYHSSVAAEIERFGGTLEKFIGDAVVALFGVPAAHEDDPERAVRAALAIRERVAGKSDVHVRLAVNTGEALVVAGARADQGEHLASGDVLNTAARLESAAPVDGVLVGEQTYWMTQKVIQYRDHEPVLARGKSALVPVWEAVGAHSRLGVDVQRSWRSPLIGREREMDLLTDALDRSCAERTVQLTTLVGVPGIGKSRLLAELFAAVDASERLVVWRQGRSLPYGEGVSFWALGEIVKAQAGILETDGPEEAAGKLATAVDDLFEGSSDARWVETHLATLVGIAPGETQTSGREERFAAWRRFFDALAERRPVVLVFEDLHWADEGLLDFVDDLVEQLTDVPLLVVATARPELLARRSTWGGGKANATTVSLTPLSDEDTSRLVHSLVAHGPLVVEVQSALLERAAGNPLYAEEFVRMLEERDSGLELPDSVHGIIAARLDALQAVDKDLLQNAAVFGKVFWAGALGAVGTTQGGEIEERLHELVRRELVRRERHSSVEGEAEYAFRHALVRDVAYGTMPRPVRAERHRRAAEWIQALGRPDDHAELIAYHYASALDLARAAGLDDRTLIEPVISSCRAAGDRAMAFASWSIAAAMFRRALELCPVRDSRRPGLLARAGEASFNDDGSGVELLDQAIDVLFEAGDLEQAAETATFAARAAWQRGDRDAAYAIAERAVEIVRDRPASRAKALALTCRASFHSFTAEYTPGLALAREALAVAVELGLDEVRARVLLVLGTTRAAMGDDGGIADMQAAAQLGLRAHHYTTVHSALNNIGEAQRHVGEWREEARALEQLRDSTLRYGTAYERRWMHAVYAANLYTLGDWDRALAESGEVIAASDAGTTGYAEPMARVTRAMIWLARDDVGRADRESELAVTAAQKAKDVQVSGPASAAQACVALASGRRGEAVSVAAQVSRLEPAAALLSETQLFVHFVLLLDDLEMREELERVLDALPAAWPWTTAGRAVASREFVRAADILSGSGHPLWEATLRMRAARALASRGMRGEAEEQVARSLEFFRSAGAVRYIRWGEKLYPALAADGDTG